jgi:hypothetical protein
MQKRILYISIFFTIILQGCYKDIVEKSNAKTVFDTFWQILDERYVNFDEKNIDWDSVYVTYSSRISAETTDNELKTILQEILNLINDLHIAIQINENEYIYTDSTRLTWSVPRQAIWNYYFNWSLLTDPIFSAQLPEDVSYLSVVHFKSSPSRDSIRTLISSKTYKGGFILDLRDNHGGYSKLMTDLLSLFCSSGYIAGYDKIKTGPARDAFAGYEKVVIDGDYFIPANILKVVLINENVYSAGNIFAGFIHYVPNTVIMGTKSSGGAGYPISVFLPNNWVLSFPRDKLYDSQYQYLEFGIDPDIVVKAPETYGGIVYPRAFRDPVIDKAIEYLKLKRK